MARCEASGERWYLPELWRIKGEAIGRGWFWRRRRNVSGAL